MAYDALSWFHTLGLLLVLTCFAVHVLAIQLEEISWSWGLWYSSILMILIVCILPTTSYFRIQTITLYLISIGLFLHGFIKQRR